MPAMPKSHGKKFASMSLTWSSVRRRLWSIFAMPSVHPPRKKEKGQWSHREMNKVAQASACVSSMTFNLAALYRFLHQPVTLARDFPFFFRPDYQHSHGGT